MEEKSITKKEQPVRRPQITITIRVWKIEED